MAFLKVMLPAERHEQDQPDCRKKSQVSAGRMKRYICEPHGFSPTLPISPLAFIGASIQLKLRKVLLLLLTSYLFCHPLLTQEKVFENECIHIGGEKAAVGVV